MEFIEGVPHLAELEVEDIEEGVNKIAEVIRPAWKGKEIKFEEKSTGYINRNYHCYVTDADDVTNDNDAIFVRIVNTRIPGQLERAVNVMRYLRRVKLGAQLLLTFGNGLVMEFLPGEPITWDTIDKVKEPETWLSFAREMAKFHSLTDFEAARELNIPSHEVRTEQYRLYMNAAVASGKIPRDKLEGLPTPDEIINGAEEIYHLLVKFGAETRFCHLDSNPTNLLIQDGGKVVLVDYDDCILDLVSSEMAGAFGSLCGILDFDIARIPTDEQQELFIREYLETRRQYEPTRGPVTDKLVQYWQFLLRKAQLMGIFTAIGIVMLLQNVSEREIDMNLCHTFHQMYLEKKDEVLAETFSWED